MPGVSLHRLLYFSRFSVAFPTLGPEQEEAIANIIQTSMRNNRMAAVSGLLLIHDGWFVQVLEGPATAVATTYDRIALDPRHEAVTLLSEGAAERRRFRDWDMCARRISNADEAILDGLEAAGRFDPTRLTADTGLDLLLSIRETQAGTLGALL
ncbi:MAG: BLUF domain-containing protein [Pseudomonadota bacterium]